MTEPALDRFRSSTIGWLRGTLAGWGTALLFVTGIVLTIAGIGQRLVDVPGLPLILTAIATGIIATVWVKNMAAAYEITDERLIVRRGIFIKSIDEVELYRVKDVRLDFTLINQMAGIGTITIGSSDETTRSGQLALRNIEHAHDRREQLRRLVNTARQKRQVREIDMIHEDI